MSVNGTSKGQQIESLLNELRSQYETLEKLYSLLQIISYNLDKNILNFLQPLNMAKAALLDELQNHKQTLDQWIQQGIGGKGEDQKRIEQEVQRLKNLAEEIQRMEEENLAKLELITEQEWLQASEERSSLCVLKNPI